MSELSTCCDAEVERDPRPDAAIRLDVLPTSEAEFPDFQTVGVSVAAKKPKPKATKRPQGRPVVVGVVTQRTVKFDAELEEAFTEEYEARAPLYKDLAYSQAASIRQLLREALAAAKAARERGQQTLPLESTTTKT